MINASGCLSEQAIELYIDGKLSKGEREVIEKHTTDCVLCKDALEGAKLFSSAGGYTKRIEQMHQSAWRRSLDARSGTRKLYYGISSVAASLIILFGIFFIMRFDGLVKKESETLTKPEVAITEPKDAIKKDVTIALEQPETEIKKPGPKKEGLKPDPGSMAVKSDISIDENLIEDDLTEEFEDGMEEVIAHEVILDEAEFKSEVVALPVMTERVEKEYDTPEAGQEEKSYMVKEVDIAEEVEQEKRSSRKAKKLDRTRANEGARLQPTSEAAYVVAEVTPMFQGGGVEEFNQYLKDSLVTIIPDSALVESVIISFVITKKGKIDKVKLISGTSSDSLNKLILDFVSDSPEWIPASISGKPIDSEQELEVVFSD